MRRLLIFFGAIIAVQLFFVSFAQQDKLAGRWEGRLQSAQGERETAVTFKKEEGESYSGTTMGLRGDEIPFKEVKVDGNKVTAFAIVDTPQGSLTVNYEFEVAAESLKGEGSVDFGGQTFTFTYDLKRVDEKTAAAHAQAEAAEQSARPPRRRVEQPQQEQSLDYFAGEWSFKYLGRESALGPAPKEGRVVFTKSADGKSLDAKIAGKTDAGAYEESALITFDAANKTLTFNERLSNGILLQSKGDWRTPISIRFAFEPLKIKGQTIQLKRTINVVSAHSFNVVEELSEDGGPFVRLGQALYTRVGPAPARN